MGPSFSLITVQDCTASLNDGIVDLGLTVDNHFFEEDPEGGFAFAGAGSTLLLSKLEIKVWWSVRKDYAAARGRCAIFSSIRCNHRPT